MSERIRIQKSSLTEDVKNYLKRELGPNYKQGMFDGPGSIEVTETDPLYEHLYLIDNLSNPVVTTASNSTESRDYSMEAVRSYIRYDYPKVATWTTMLEYAKFYLTTPTVSTPELYAFARYMASQLTDGTNYLGDIASPLEGVKVHKVELPQEPKGYKEESKKIQFDLSSINEDNAPKIIPVIFFNFLRFKMGMTKENSKKRLKNTSRILTLFRMADVSFIFPEDHYWFNLINGDTLIGDEDRDLLTKAIFWRNKPNSDMAKLCGALIGQNAYLWGLSHITSYRRIYERLGSAKIGELAIVLNHPDKRHEYNLFKALIAFTKSQLAEDKVWPCCRLIDPAFLYKWSPRMMPFVTMTLAYIETVMKITADGNDSYEGYQKQSRPFPRLMADQLAYCNLWIRKWLAQEEQIVNRFLPTMPETNLSATVVKKSPMMSLLRKNKDDDTESK